MLNDRFAAAHLDTPRILDWILQELLAMAHSVGIDWRSECLFGLYRSISQLLDDIGRLANAGRIHPRQTLLVAPTPEPPSASSRALRVGVYPIAGDPIHWGHLSSALLAIARLRLDKVVFVIVDGGAKRPATMSKKIRHEMAAAYLPCFLPVFVNAPIARDADLDGETSLFRLLELNRRQPLHAFYLAGNEHCRRVNPVTGEPDTIGKLERNVADRLFDYDARRHRLSVAFFENERRWTMPKSSLPITRLPSPPIRVSSASILRALEAGRSDAVLLALPYTVFRSIVAAGLCDRARRAPTFRGKPSSHVVETVTVVGALHGMN